MDIFFSIFKFFIESYLRITEIIRYRIFQPYKWNNRIFNLTKSGKEHKRCLKILHGLTKKVMMEKNEEFLENNFSSQKRVAFLDMLLKEKQKNNSLTFDDIQEEVDTFMFEGHDTTAVSSSWACQLIGSHPDVQKKIHDELDSIFGNFLSSYQ